MDSKHHSLTVYTPQKSIQQQLNEFLEKHPEYKKTEVMLDSFDKAYCNGTYQD